MNFDFGDAGSIDAYTPERGIGFEGQNKPTTIDVATPDGIVSACTSDEPYFVSTRLPEGAYHITVRLVGAEGGSTVAVKAESRRAMLGNVEVPEGEVVERTFSVWLLAPNLPGGGEMRLTNREIGIPGYDDKLTLEFTGVRPTVASLQVEPAQDITNVFLAGDSTVADQPNEPWSAWGAMLPMYFDESVAVANLASSGRALRSFRGERRLEKLLSLLQAGDYVLIQFGHNDQKETGEGIGPFLSYKDDLEQYISAIREKGGKPVLVTSMVRRRFDREGAWYDTLGDYPEAVRQVAREQAVPLIDLHQMSRQIVESLGEVESKLMFVHYPAGTLPGQVDALKDDTHFNTYGGDLLARAVIRGIHEALPDLASHLRDPATTIDLEHPEPFESWQWPQSPSWQEFATPEER